MKAYMYDVAKGLPVLMYQRASEGIDLILTESWNKFHDPKVPEKQMISYLRLAKDYHSEILNIVQNDPTVMGFMNMTDRARRLGITPKYPPMPELTEEQAAEDYRNMNNKGYTPHVRRIPLMMIILVVYLILVILMTFLMNLS